MGPFPPLTNFQEIKTGTTIQKRLQSVDMNYSKTEIMPYNILKEEELNLHALTRSTQT